MKFKVGDYCKIVYSIYSDCIIGDIVRIVEINEFDYFPYTGKYLTKNKFGYTQDIFNDNELVKISKDLAMVYEL